MKSAHFVLPIQPFQLIVTTSENSNVRIISARVATIFSSLPTRKNRFPSELRGHPLGPSVNALRELVAGMIRIYRSLERQVVESRHPLKRFLTAD